jgi:hypothetical protein
MAKKTYNDLQNITQKTSSTNSTKNMEWTQLDRISQLGYA